MNLVEWAEAYVTHRDLFERRIERKERRGNDLLITQKDGLQYPCLVRERLDETVLPELAGAKTILVTRNLKENVLFVAKRWKELSGNAGLKLIFANAAKNEKWVLVPSGHARVADPESLELGLVSMHETVAEG